jgi:hypothetical protein
VRDSVLVQCILESRRQFVFRILSRKFRHEVVVHHHLCREHRGLRDIWQRVPRAVGRGVGGKGLKCIGRFGGVGFGRYMRGWGDTSEEEPR